MEDNVNHPKHYAPCFDPIQLPCISVSREMPFSLGNSFKYVWRAGNKGDSWKAVEDLSKASWYVKDFEKSDVRRRTDLTVAKAIFDLVPQEASLRWETLHYIVNDDLEAAAQNIECFKKEMTPDFIWKNDLAAGDFSARKVVEPVYCDDIPFELLEGRNNSPIDPHLILDDPDLANKVEDALKTVREYKQFLETVVQS